MSNNTASGALAHSQEGVVTSPHTLATEAGLEVLRKGGNAVEAAITMGACLSVTYPHFTGLGGDAFMIIADANGGVRMSDHLPDTTSEIEKDIPRAGDVEAEEGLLIARVLGVWDVEKLPSSNARVL